MYICQNRLFAFLWRLFALIITLLSQLIRLNSQSFRKHFVYFTNQTNLMLILLFAYLTFQTFQQIQKKGGHGPIAHLPCALQLACVFLISITMIVYWSLLFKPGHYVLSLSAFSGFCAHAICPMLAILDWILFMPHGRIQPRITFFWLLYPLLYCAFIFLRAKVGGFLSQTSRYPYFFMDADIYHISQLLLFGITLFAGFWLLAYLYYVLDKALFLLEIRYNKRMSPVRTSPPPQN